MTQALEVVNLAMEASMRNAADGGLVSGYIARRDHRKRHYAAGQSCCEIQDEASVSDRAGECL
jgi:hypothetical protein